LLRPDSRWTPRFARRPPHAEEVKGLRLPHLEIVEHAQPHARSGIGRLDMLVRPPNISSNLGMEQRFVVDTPLMWIDKAQTLRLSRRSAATS
jgi:hypothetical protein